MKTLKVGVDSYSLKPLDLGPFELLEWAVMNDADGVQFSEVNLPPGQAVDKPFLEELRGYVSRREGIGGADSTAFSLVLGYRF